MRKLFFILLLFLAANLGFSQGGYTPYAKLRLTSVPTLDNASEQVLVRDPITGNINYFPKTSLFGLQATLNGGKTAEYDSGNSSAEILGGTTNNRTFKFTLWNGLANTNPSYYYTHFEAIPGAFQLNSSVNYSGSGSKTGQFDVSSGTPRITISLPGGSLQTFVKLDDPTLGSAMYHFKTRTSGDYNVAVEGDIPVVDMQHASDNGPFIETGESKATITADGQTSSTWGSSEHLWQNVAGHTTAADQANVYSQYYDSGNLQYDLEMHTDAFGAQLNYKRGTPAASAQIRFDYVNEENVVFNHPDKVGNQIYAMEEDVNAVSDDVSDINNTKDLPTDFFISSGVGVNLLYYSDSYRTIDISGLVGPVVTNTNEIVRNGNDLFIIGNFIDNATNEFVLRLVGCKLVNGELTYQSTDWASFQAPRVHSLRFHRGYLYGATRADDNAVAQKIIKMNPYDFSDYKVLSLPIAGNTVGSTGDMVCYKNALYILIASGSGVAQYLYKIDENLNAYEQILTYGGTSGKRVSKTSPFAIYNDEIYIPNMGRGAGVYNQVGMGVFSMTGTLKREVSAVVANVAPGTTDWPYAHWMQIVNGKIIVTSFFNTLIMRWDTASLALEESVALPVNVTDDNTLKRDGTVYLGGDVTGGSLYSVKYNDFTTLTTVSGPAPMDYNGSINYDYSQKESLVSKVSDLSNDALAATITDGDITHSPDGNSVFDALALKANLASPTFTGTPTLPTGTIATTQTAGNSSTAIATTAFVTTADNLKANLASPTFTGTPTLPTGTIATTQTAGNSTTAVATTAFVTTADNLKANLASPSLTGTPVAPTASTATNNTQIATTAFVNNAINLYQLITGVQTISTGATFVEVTGTTTATLPSAVTTAGKFYMIKNSGTGVVTINTTSSQTIDGVLTFTLPTQYDAFEVRSDGANWKIFGNSVLMQIFNVTSVAFTSITLNSTYPNVPVLFRVVSPNIGSGMIYTKMTEAGSSDVWHSQSTAVVP